MNRLVVQQSLLMIALVVFSVLSLSLIHAALQIRTAQSVFPEGFWQANIALWKEAQTLSQDEQNRVWASFLSEQYLMAAEQGKNLTLLNRSMFNPDALLLASSLAILLGVFLAFIFSRRIVQPVLTVTNAAEQLSRGELNVRVDKPSRWVSREVKDLTADFNKMAGLLEHSESERKALIADVAHELRTPLTILQGHLDAMLEGYMEPSTENLTLLAERTEMLGKLVRDLRTLSLSDSERLTLELGELDLVMVLEHTALAWQKKVEAKGVSLGLETQLEQALVKADRQRLTQVLDNLLGNALRFTPEGGQIELRLGHAADTYAITVKDSGEGIPESDIAHVFERFYKGKAKQSGSGLGLSIAQSLIKLHGGSLSVRNARAGGAEFEVRLPQA